MLSTLSPWFLATVRIGDGADLWFETFALAWEITLIELVKEVGESNLVALQMLESCGDKAGAWATRVVHEVWLTSGTEARELGPLLLRFAGEEMLVNAHRIPTSDPGATHTLLARLNN